MWDRGDKAPVIAAALGCKVGAVNVARARFGLKPRRVVSGRPKEPDEPAHKIRARGVHHFATSWSSARRKNWSLRLATKSYQWLRVIAKELVDNGIDGCEEAGIAPVIKVTIKTGKSGKPTRIVVEDNGPGIPPETVTGIIDYNVRISSREAYISPTRGRQGNALKTILPMAYVLGGKAKGETWIEARGLKHRHLFTVNQIKQEPIVNNSGPVPGSRPARASRCSGRTMTRPIDPDEIADLLCNLFGSIRTSRLQFTVDGKTLFRLSRHQPRLDEISSLRCDLGALVFAGAIRALCRGADRTGSGTAARHADAKYHGQGIHRPVPGHERDRQAESRFCANSRRRTCRCARFFGSETQVNHQRMEKLLALLQQAHPAGASGIARRHWRGASAAICASSSAANRRASNISPAPVMTPTACRTWSRSQPVPSKNGSTAKTKHGAAN